MKTTTNRVLVIGIDNSRWKDKITTPGGLELYVAPTSKHATQDIKYEGIVVAAPLSLTGYRKNDTEVRIRRGDRVWFNYKTMMRPPVMRATPEELDLLNDSSDRIPVWECDYSDIFCKLEDGELKPIGDWVLLEKIKEVEQFGSGVLINPFEEVKESHAVIAHISEGVNLQTQDGPLCVGDKVIFKHDEGAFENEINGKTYWCCPADIIHAKL